MPIHRVRSILFAGLGRALSQLATTADQVSKLYGADGFVELPTPASVVSMSIDALEDLLRRERGDERRPDIDGAGPLASLQHMHHGHPPTGPWPNVSVIDLAAGEAPPPVDACPPEDPDVSTIAIEDVKPDGLTIAELQAQLDQLDVQKKTIREQQLHVAWNIAHKLNAEWKRAKAEPIDHNASYLVRDEQEDRVKKAWNDYAEAHALVVRLGGRRKSASTGAKRDGEWRPTGSGMSELSASAELNRDSRRSHLGGRGKI